MNTVPKIHTSFQFFAFIRLPYSFLFCFFHFYRFKKLFTSAGFFPLLNFVFLIKYLWNVSPFTNNENCSLLLWAPFDNIWTFKHTVGDLFASLYEDYFFSCMFTVRDTEFDIQDIKFRIILSFKHKMEWSWSAIDLTVAVGWDQHSWQLMVINVWLQWIRIY